ncbi:YeeE/YedE family protein [Methylobacillus caricis]|uniref:YeeE/YedE family protein n=1 Tax=Methylobacillus caricis TaxID=1971611 RepID=UPI001CFF871A|nr:YeeE/YedE family protein [Methylobacillus caricis]MCB5187106.1 YeeE/YedE family protein [Methylobacillus caricis]
MVDWTHATPLSSLAGGVLIGLAAALLLVMNGRIAGISGILGGLLKASWSDSAWRICFLTGLVASPWLYSFWAPLPGMVATSDINLLVVAGLLVGLGTRLGSGCTSGHGVCGIARLSPRSIVATLIFMLAAMATVYIRHRL